MIDPTVDPSSLVAQLTTEHGLLEQLRRRYSQLALLAVAAEYRCLPQAVDEIAQLEAELGAADLIRAILCDPDATCDDILNRAPDSEHHSLVHLVTEMRRLYLETTSYRTLALDATDERLAELARN